MVEDQGRPDGSSGASLPEAAPPYDGSAGDADDEERDAMRLDLSCAQTSIIYGDSLSISIAAASVIAKVYRDGRMREVG